VIRRGAESLDRRAITTSAAAAGGEERRDGARRDGSLPHE